MRILYAEDERDLAKIILRKLEKEGYGVDWVENGDDAIRFFEAAEYDAVILDIMMPGKTGLDVLRLIRRSGRDVPVLFLTARDSTADRVRGLDLGADDYLVKPFALEELLARVRVLLRKRAGAGSSVITCEDLELNQAEHTVRRGGEPIDLTAKEFALLEYLMMHQGQVLSREQIENHVWNFDYEGGTNVIDVYISYLRRKLERDGAPSLIHTVRGVGYRMGVR